MYKLILKLFLVTFITLLSARLSTAMPDCTASGSFENCTFTNENGTYVGQLSNGKINGQGTFIWLNGDRKSGEWILGNQHGFGVYFHEKDDRFKGDRFFGFYKNDKRLSGLYVSSGGKAKFFKKYKSCKSCVDDNVHNVLPKLKQAFVSLSIGDRKIIQNILKGKDIYDYAVDGVWGKNTLNAIAEFAVLELKTIDFNNKKVANNILETLLDNKKNFLSKFPKCSRTEYRNKCYGQYIYSDGDKYVGEFIDNKKYGQGTYTFNNGNKYVGQFKNDKYEGHGTFYFLTDDKNKGHKYVGEFKNGKYEGYGTFYFLADDENIGSQYIGNFKNNKFDGQGSFIWANGMKDVGSYKNGKLDGYASRYNTDGSLLKAGIFKADKFQYAQAASLPDCPTSGYFNNCFGNYSYNDGGEYIGEFKDDKRHGQGTFIFPSGNKYVGDWFANKREGQGILFYKGGDKYEGDFKNDKMSGQGVYTFSSGSKDVGMFGNDKLNGFAKRYDSDGNIDQEGIFKDDIFQFAQKNKRLDCPSSGYFDNCFGTKVFDNGNKYVGDWRSNKRHGQGTQTWPNGGRYVGEWKEGKQNGQGIEAWPSGDKYVGEYKNNKRHGRGTHTWAEGGKYVGEWKDGLQSGEGIEAWPSGDKYVGEYKENKRNGQGTYTFEDGSKYFGEWKDHYRNGHGTLTLVDGSKWVGEWKNSKLNGYAITYLPDGRIHQEGIFEDDTFKYAKKLSPYIEEKKNTDDVVINASSGSGFAVSADGYVITNNHVIDGCQEVIVHTKEKEVKTKIISYDPQNDLALLKGDFSPKTVFSLSNQRPELLQDVYVAGYPFGNAISSSIKVTKGIISSLTGIGNNFSNMQIDAALQSGNSGGPILDDYGNVIGVAVSKLDSKYMLENFGSIPENTNFGIKSSVVRSILDSNNVVRPDPNKIEISKSKLGKMISNGTYYISCWMTQAQIELLRSKKVLFEGLN